MFLVHIHNLLTHLNGKRRKQGHQTLYLKNMVRTKWTPKHSSQTLCKWAVGHFILKTWVYIYIYILLYQLIAAPQRRGFMWFWNLITVIYSVSLTRALIFRDAGWLTDDNPAHPRGWWDWGHDFVQASQGFYSKLGNKIASMEFAQWHNAMSTKSRGFQSTAKMLEAHSKKKKKAVALIFPLNPNCL